MEVWKEEYRSGNANAHCKDRRQQRCTMRSTDRRRGRTMLAVESTSMVGAAQNTSHGVSRAQQRSQA